MYYSYCQKNIKSFTESFMVENDHEKRRDGNYNMSAVKSNWKLHNYLNIHPNRVFKISLILKIAVEKSCS